ncbi:MAG: hypothetical protein LC793_02650, partial [Thermomicrobia bacterium]|nr:hypothetical protein [Thermomicrobia bacterium]
MDLILLYKELRLSPDDLISLAAPDRTGWANVELWDGLTGESELIGQVKGNAFRPTGALVPTLHFGGRASTRAEKHLRAERERLEEQAERGASLAKWLVYPICALIMGWLYAS